MSRRSVIFISLLAVLVVAAATYTAFRLLKIPTQGAVLPGTEWVLISVNGKTLIEGSQITLRFAETSLDGSGGCNTYGGSFTASQDVLGLSDLYWTEMACLEPEGVMEQEQAYLHALDAATGYRVDGDRLEMYDEAGAQVLVFSAAGEPSSTS